MKILQSGNGSDGHGAGSPILALAFSRNGGLLVRSAEDRTLCLWSVSSDLSQSARKATRQGAHRSNCFSFDPGGTHLAAGQSDGAIQFWTAGATLTESTRFDAHSGPTLHVAFSPNGEWLASAIRYAIF